MKSNSGKAIKKLFKHIKRLKTIINNLSNKLSLEYKSPGWLRRSNNIDYIVLSKDTPIQEVDLFLIGLFGYNGIDFEENPKYSFMNLLYELEKNSLALGGGILSYNTQRKIFPSCCCGLERWGEVVQDIIDKKSPWLGHDPCPVIEYLKHSTIIWSDDCLGVYSKKTKQDLFSIEFDEDDLKSKVLNIEKELFEFFTIPFQSRINELCNLQLNELTERLLSWLKIRV